MNMREAFDNYYGGDKRRSVRHPETYIDFTTQTVWESFEAGYAAAIEAVKAGGAYDCAKGDEFSCACSMYKLYKLPEEKP